MKYYKTGFYAGLIKEVEVTKETTKCVYVKNEFNGKEERVMKSGSYSNYFKTYLEAKEFLENKKKSEIQQLEKQLEYQKMQLEKIYNL